MHVYFYAPPSGPVKSEPHILPDHRACGQKLPRASTREISPLCVCKKKILTTCRDKSWVRDSAQDINAAVAVSEIGSAEIFFFFKERGGGILLTYLVARSVRFLQPHPPLIVQFD